jgi:hypothetical protein
MYKCVDCEKIYPAMTSDGSCERDDCFGAPLVEASAGPSSSKGESAPSAPVEGLCILVCDISFSMNEPAFVNSPAQKLKMVVGAIQRAIFELKDLAKADTAYIALVAFGRTAALVKDAQGRPFFKSVSEIMREYGESAKGLTDYLYDYFENDRGGIGRDETDITEGLTVARRIADCMFTEDLSSIGVTASAKLMEHSDIMTMEGKHISFPNIRVMIYSDGAHGSNIHSNLTNMFDDLNPSPLMTAFIGDPSISPAMQMGSQQMERIANTCPEHGKKGFFLINDPNRYTVLRGLFRMASGASGFCEECLKGEMKNFENVR